MPRITVELLRKRAEHNEMILSTLEEISLHQEELERIEVIGSLCRKLRILYLQNNIIERIEDLTHMKELRYLNLALNNVSKIEGLQSCEFLNKLDLTVNFVDFDELEASLDHLKPLEHLRELYMLGNPCQANWPTGFHEYAIASLPQLELLDGKEVHKSDRIKALQVFGANQRYVREQAVKVRAEKAAKQQQLELERAAEAKRKEAEHAEDVIDVVHGEATDISRSGAVDEENRSEKQSVMASQEKVPYTPETRREMYMEMAEQKEAEEARRRENMPKERDTEAEHEAALRQTRLQEERADGSVRQCNEGKWEFRLMDEPLEVVLEVDLPRFLDTSLVDVDVHPSYVSIVAKNKVFRLRFPELVHSDAGKAERSKVTGTLRLTLPKANVSAAQRLRAQMLKDERQQQETPPKQRVAEGNKSCARTKRATDRRQKTADELHEAASGVRTSSTRPSGCVRVRGLVENQEEDANSGNTTARTKLTPLVTKKLGADADHGAANQQEDEDCPPLVY